MNELAKKKKETTLNHPLTSKKLEHYTYIVHLSTSSKANVIQLPLYMNVNHPNNILNTAQNQTS